MDIYWLIGSSLVLSLLVLILFFHIHIPLASVCVCVWGAENGHYFSSKRRIIPFDLSYFQLFSAYFRYTDFVPLMGLDFFVVSLFRWCCSNGGDSSKFQSRDKKRLNLTMNDFLLILIWFKRTEISSNSPRFPEIPAMYSNSMALQKNEWFRLIEHQNGIPSITYVVRFCMCFFRERMCLMNAYPFWNDFVGFDIDVFCWQFIIIIHLINGSLNMKKSRSRHKTFIFK